LARLLISIGKIMLQQMTVQRLSVRTFFKLCLIGNSFTIILVWMWLTASALMGAPLVAWEDEYVTGKWTTIVGPVVVVVAVLLCCAVQTLLASLGLLLFAKFRSITIGYIR
jgi:hypothetical protein